MKNKCAVHYEVYSVRFWLTNPQGFKEQRSEQIQIIGNNKCGHKKAELGMKLKYRKAPFNQKIEVVNVTYC